MPRLLRLELRLGRVDAEFTGRLAACAGSCGPGTLHFINGLYAANRNRAPVIVIALYIACNFVYLNALPLDGSPAGVSILERGIKYAAEDRVEAVALDRLEQRHGLQRVARAVRPLAQPPGVDELLHRRDEQAYAVVLDRLVAVGDHLGEVVPGGDVQHG